MATRTLLKLKPNFNLPQRSFLNPTFALTRSVTPITLPDSTSLSLFKPSTVSFPGTLARQMATARSPRGAPRMDEEEEEEERDGDFDDEDMDDGDEGEFDLDDEFDDGDEFDDEDDEEEKPRGKKSYPKEW